MFIDAVVISLLPQAPGAMMPRALQHSFAQHAPGVVLMRIVYSFMVLGQDACMCQALSHNSSPLSLECVCVCVCVCVQLLSCTYIFNTLIKQAILHLTKVILTIPLNKW